jgi:DNA-binding CsgD family transcriptional regulator
MLFFAGILAVSGAVAVLKTMLVLRYLVDGATLDAGAIFVIWAVAFALTGAVVVGGLRLMQPGLGRSAPASTDTDILCRVRIIERFAAEWGLSDAERDVAVFVVKGFSNAEIAEFRGSAVATVKAQLGSIFRKSGLENRVQLIALVSDEVVVEAQDLVGRAHGIRAVPAAQASE